MQEKLVKITFQVVYIAVYWFGEFLLRPEGAIR